MSRVIWLAVLALVGCDDGDDHTPTGRNPGALDNGQKCLFTSAGANVCAGSLCIGIASESPFGVCSELCGAGGVCQHGGACVELDGVAGRVCLADCFNSADCGDQLTCSPSEDVRPCNEDGVCSVDLDRFWCQPPLPR